MVVVAACTAIRNAILILMIIHVAETWGLGGQRLSGHWAVKSPHELRTDSVIPTPAIDIPPAPDVSDPVLAYLISRLEADVHDTLTVADIERGIRTRRGESLIPLHCLRRIGRGSAASHTCVVTTIELTEEQVVPAPYSLLGYHPGSVIVPERVVLLEWQIGDLTITERRRKKLVKLKDCYLWAVESGTVTVDIDAWVDALLGGSVDDITVRSLALFRLEGCPYAMAMGFNRNGKGRSGALNLRENELVFPTPWQLKAAGKFLRRRALQRLDMQSIASPEPRGTATQDP
jgi:hypothetical protein